MWPYFSDLLSVPVPRYTSFPTAADFGEAVGPDNLLRALGDVGADEGISLYLHIPYCAQLCWYCGCNTGAANRHQRVNAYIDRLGDEIALIAAGLAGRGRVRRIAWGGGSPNALAPAAFDALMDRLAGAFRLDDPVISVEIDPRGFDAEWASALQRNHVTRVSLGVQTLDDDIQRGIGRVQPAALIARVVDQLRGAGVDSLNFDLMYGLPGQSIARLGATFDAALALQPDRLAVFGYAHVPHMVPRQKLIDASALPDGFARFAQAAFAYQRLTGDGYQPIGFDHFARPGDSIAVAARNGTLRRNFQGFTEDPADVLLGLGTSAISSFPAWLLQNEKHNGRYQLSVGNGRPAIARGLWRSPADRGSGRAIEQLLCQGRTDLAGWPDIGVIRAQLQRFIAAGLAEWQGDRLVVAADGLPYVRSMAAVLDPYRAATTRRFSSAI
ncbi:MAG: oxygen-independent coproporphyrinogen III oxidase [Alphaproteobacteria bacterium PA4]|nr:MAG: oxygen-independent coproporphyrinogen III oxidase [Alphaproteobacteria bacterium PA4]